VLVGNTQWNMEVFNGINHFRDVRIISIEEFELLENKDDYQYFCAGADTSFRKMVVDKITSLVDEPNFPSFVSKSVHAHPAFKVGKNCLVCAFVSVSGPTVLKDHCVISHFVQFSHVKSVLEDYCFIGPYTSIVDCHLGTGTWCGHHCMFLKIQTQPWSQFFMESRVTRHTFTESGTFKNTKKLRDDNSLTGSLKT
jgi:hypothetical protein